MKAKNQGTLLDRWDDFTTQEKQYMVRVLKRKIPNIQIGALPFVSIKTIGRELWLNPYIDDTSTHMEINLLRKLKHFTRKYPKEML